MMTVLRYFLEINISEPINKNVLYFKNSNLKIEKKNNFKVNKFFYKQIGADHFWRDRLIWTDKQWMNYTSEKNVKTFVLKNKDDYVGYFELIIHIDKKEVEIAYLGLLEEYHNKKLGSFLLSSAIINSFKEKMNRVWVHTCSLDHKYALKNYLSRGMKIFKKETIST